MAAQIIAFPQNRIIRVCKGAKKPHKPADPLLEEARAALRKMARKQGKTLPASMGEASSAQIIRFPAQSAPSVHPGNEATEFELQTDKLAEMIAERAIRKQQEMQRLMGLPNEVDSLIERLEQLQGTLVGVSPLQRSKLLALSYGASA